MRLSIIAKLLSGTNQAYVAIMICEIPDLTINKRLPEMRTNRSCEFDLNATPVQIGALKSLLGRNGFLNAPVVDKGEAAGRIRGEPVDFAEPSEQIGEIGFGSIGGQTADPEIGGLGSGSVWFTAS